MTPRTYSTTEINALAGTGWCYWRLDRLVRTGKVIALNRERGKERRFSRAEALKAISLLREGAVSSVKELKEMAKGEADERN